MISFGSGDELIKNVSASSSHTFHLPKPKSQCSLLTAYPFRILPHFSDMGYLKYKDLILTWNMAPSAHRLCETGALQ